MCKLCVTMGKVCIMRQGRVQVEKDLNWHPIRNHEDKCFFLENFAKTKAKTCTIVIV